jgi:Na+:H+ antiporter
VTQLLLWLAVILIAAKLGGDLATRAGQPPVLGELIAGVLIGSLDIAGVPGVAAMRHDVSLDMLAGLGAILLLFEVGLESTVGQMMKVGWRSFLVAAVGVVLPFALGWAAGAWMLPQSGR